MGRLSPDAEKYLRNLFLDAAHDGKRVLYHQLMIGDHVVDTDAHENMTFEAVRDVVYRLLEEGLVEFDNRYRIQLTEKGKELYEVSR